MEKDKSTPGFYIPWWIATREDISSSAKMLYGVLMTFKSFDGEGVWASRKFLGNQIAKTPSTVSDLIRALKKADLVHYNGEKVLLNGNQMRLLKKTPPNSILLAPYGKTNSPPIEKPLISNIYENIYSTRFKKSCGSPLYFERNTKIRPSYYRFADQFQDKQIDNHPSKYKQYSPSQLANQIKNGGEVIDKLIRLDSWDFCKDIKPAINWAIKDDFWSINVRSLASLRNTGSNGESKFTNIFDGWEMWKKNKDKKPAKKKFNEDSRNPSRKVMRKGPDGYFRGVWE